MAEIPAKSRCGSNDLAFQLSRPCAMAPGGQNRPVLEQGVRGLQQSQEYVRYLEFNGVGL